VLSGCVVREHFIQQLVAGAEVKAGVHAHQNFCDICV
jgi:hypothetical protein